MRGQRDWLQMGFRVNQQGGRSGKGESRETESLHFNGACAAVQGPALLALMPGTMERATG